MTPRPLTLPEGVTASVAIAFMTNRRIRHVPIVDSEHRYLGMVSVVALSLLTPGESVDAAMERRPATELRACAAAAARFMFRSKTEALAVVEGERVVGILTESDFVRAYIRHAAERGCEHESILEPRSIPSERAS